MPAVLIIELRNVTMHACGCAQYVGRIAAMKTHRYSELVPLFLKRAGWPPETRLQVCANMLRASLNPAAASTQICAAHACMHAAVDACVVTRLCVRSRIGS
jgi:hypothetical protein